MILIEIAQIARGNDLTSVVSETMPHLRRGAVRDFLNIMKAHHYYQESRWNRTDYTYHFETGNKMEFFSADMPSKVRGPRRNKLFINECNNISYETYTQLAIRTDGDIYLDYNPVSEFWVHEEVIPNMDHDFIILTYKDNEALPQTIVDEIESRRGNRNFWLVYGRGLLGVAEGRIYKDWKIIDEIPHEALLAVRGLDFGYTNDPSVLLDIYEFNGGYIFDEQFYRKGMSNKKIADFIIALDDPNVLTIADSAEPKSIDEIKSYGVSIVGAKKGQGSVSQGIDFVQSQKISVTKQSINTVKCYRNYLWKIDKDGKTLNVPEHEFSDCFVGETLVKTNKGAKEINKIKKGDMVFTREGYKPVVKRYDNGKKRVMKYRLQLDTSVVELECTPNHHILTNEGWVKISKLKLGMMVFHTKSLGVRNISFIKEGSILKRCIKMCGSFTMGRLRRDIAYITKIIIDGIIRSRIWKSLRVNIIIKCIRASASRITQSFYRGFKLLASRPQKYGTSRKKDANGTRNMVKNRGSIGNTERLNVKCAEKDIKQDMGEFQNTVIKTAKLKHLEEGESSRRRTYDIHIEGVHEYFANGLLVHNSMDAGRYGLSGFQRGTGNKKSYEDEYKKYIESLT